ncbi:MAG: heavy metal translocating P-type ATPase [Algisphaera sp.]
MNTPSPSDFNTDSSADLSADPGPSGACLHCGLPIPAARRNVNPADTFCCAGCQTVYETLSACGLDNYYRLRDAVNAKPTRGAATQQRYAAFDADAFTTIHVRVLDRTDRTDGTGSATHTTDFRLEGVHCAACVWLVERLPRVVNGVIEARLSLRETTVRVTWNPATVALSKIAESLDRLGYPPHPAQGADRTHLRQKSERAQLLRIGVAGLCAGNSMITALALYAGEGLGSTTVDASMDSGIQFMLRLISAGLGLLSLAWPGSVFFRGALASLRTRTPTLDLPIALALGVGGAAGLAHVILGRGEIYFDSLTVLVFLLLVGRFIQSRQQRFADDAVGLMAALTPAACRVQRADQWIETPIEALTPGDRVQVRPGELFPADGNVDQGHSTMDRALLTGESVAVPVAPGDGVFAGAQNLASPLEITVTAAANDTRIAELVRLVDQGIREKPPLVLFADRVAGWFVVVVTLAAAATFATWFFRTGLEPAIENAVALLIVACPCALGLATPLALAVAIARAGQRNILIKNGAAVEVLAKSGHLLLDKTGTLTHGRAQLAAWHGPDHLKPLVAAAEAHSTHPIARALVNALSKGQAENQNDTNLLTHTQISNIQERGDGGLTATHANQTLHIGSPNYLRRHGVHINDTWQATLTQHLDAGQTVVAIALSKQENQANSELQAIAALGDTLRQDIASAVAQLQTLGWQTQILSGDAQPVVDAVAQQTGISQARGDATPEDKLQAVQKLTAASQKHTRPRPVIMVGDGVNDAAALAAADIGIAVHGGAQAALAAADLYIARPGLQPLVELITLCKASVHAARRSLIISLVYNAIALALAATGHITPLVAAILMPLSSAIVLASALAPGRQRPRPQTPTPQSP